MDHIEVKNLVPDFIDFFDEASRRSMSEKKRFELWKETYDFAAVPPGVEGEKIARTMLANTWPKYFGEIETIKSWEPENNIIENPLFHIKKLLRCDEPIDLVLIYFVGSFEGNFFTAPYDSDRTALCIPIESEVNDIILYHELTHIVHQKTAGLSLNWERPVANLIMQEGLATRISQHLKPGKNEEIYIEFTPGWLKTCEMKKEEIIEGIMPYFNDARSETLMKFTLGEGTTGLEREAYYVGWLIVGSLLDAGVSFEEMAKIPGDQLAQYIFDACRDMIEVK